MDNSNKYDIKQAIINKIYFDKSGYGSIKRTFDDARKLDKTITINDIKQFYKNNVEQKKQLKGYNSFIPPYPYYEYQLDLFFINDLENQNFKIGMIMIDIFTKYIVIVPIKSKSEGDIAAGLIECLHRMGHNPEIIYSDDETSLNTNAIQKYLKEQNIKHIITRSHAWFVERAIRTIKDMLYKRIDNSKDDNPQWTDFLFEVVLTYNNKLVHSITKHTPNEASDEKNELNVKLNLLFNKNILGLIHQLK